MIIIYIKISLIEGNTNAFQGSKKSKIKLKLSYANLDYKLGGLYYIPSCLKKLMNCKILLQYFEHDGKCVIFNARSIIFSFCLFFRNVLSSSCINKRYYFFILILLG